MTCLPLNSLHFFLASSAKMGLVETKLAIIPGGGMNCSLLSLSIFDLAPDVSAGQRPAHGEGSIWVKEADAVRSVLSTQGSASLWPVGISLHSALCVVMWSMLVSPLARSPYRITASLKLCPVYLNLCSLIPECQVHS